MFKPEDDAIYLCDNGAAYCGEHLGHTARMTGSDISGQPVVPVCAEMLEDEGYEIIDIIACERCGKKAAS